MYPFLKTIPFEVVLKFWVSFHLRVIHPMHCVSPMPPPIEYVTTLMHFYSNGHNIYNLQTIEMLHVFSNLAGTK